MTVTDHPNSPAQGAATADSAHDLDDALRAVRRPLPARRGVRVGLGVRLRTTPRLRSVIPHSVAVRRAISKGEALWDASPQRREQALAALTAIVSGTAREDELEELARRHLVEVEVREAVFWRPWIAPAMDERSTARLRAAIEQGRGVLLSGCHTGAFCLQLGATLPLKSPQFSVLAPWFFQPPPADHWGRTIDRWWNGRRDRGEHVVCSNGAFPILRELLRQGEVVQLAYDMPGSRETEFLGKPVMLATGSARLALESDAIVLPIRVVREGIDFSVEIGEEIDPRGFSSMEDLHDTFAVVQERWVLESPETFEDPRRPGAWEAQATARRWDRPARSQRS